MCNIELSSRDKTTALHCVVGILVVITAAMLLIGGMRAAVGDQSLFVAAWLGIRFDVAALLLVGSFLDYPKGVLGQWWSAAKAHLRQTA
jgi:hypothetical protein